MSRSNIFRDGRVHLMAQMCETCIFRPGNLMRLSSGRVKGMVSESLQNGAGITCHDTLGTDENALCRGFWDRYHHRAQLLELADRMGIVTEVGLTSDE